MKIYYLKTISVFVLLALLTLFQGAYRAAAVNDDGRKIYYTLLKGTINSELADDFEGVLQEAEKVKAKALILEIDTFGGRLDAAVRIKDKLVDTKINTIAFVNKKGNLSRGFDNPGHKTYRYGSGKYHRGGHTC